jgi:hypothetical protein
LEILSGVPFGLDANAGTEVELQTTPRWPRDPAPVRQALDRALRRALCRPPCLVAFSGGRDSSVLLAAAVDLARREGHEQPIPVTLRFSAAATTETEWQHLVVEHLGVGEWVRLQLGNEVDFVGGIATAALLRHGLLYPANAHFVVPMARVAGQGSIVTGLGGDDIFGSWAWSRLADVLARRVPPRPGDLRLLARCAAPHGLRAAVARRTEPVCSLPWLHGRLRETASMAVARELTASPRQWHKRMKWLSQWRFLGLARSSVARLAADAGVIAVSPLIDRTFLSALGQSGGSLGWGDRTATVTALFADLLPGQILRRRVKAEFSRPLFGEATRRFARSWSGSVDLPHADLDVPVLRAIWASEQPHFLSSTLLQAAWLSDDRRGISSA